MNLSALWLKRDLRLRYHPGFSLLQGSCLIFYVLEEKNERRRQFILDGLLDLHENLKGRFAILEGSALDLIPLFLKEHKVKTLYTQREYEPKKIFIQKKLESILNKEAIEVKTYKNHVLFEHQEIFNKEKKPYHIYTSYQKTWLKQAQSLKPLTQPYNFKCFNKVFPFHHEKSSLKGGFQEGEKKLSSFLKKIAHYSDTRNDLFEGTSSLSPYLRQGMLDLSDLYFQLRSKPEHTPWIHQLIWNNFFHNLLQSYPRLVQEPFRQEISSIPFEENEKLFQAWKEGKTGFPLVDAAMKYFNRTSLMPNRLRMLVASVLCKILFLPYQWGEDYFAHHLLDFDLALNNGNWQWCASSGVDSVPYFRIFNPYLQSKKFDPQGLFITKEIPELKKYSPEVLHDEKQLHDFYPAKVHYKEQREKVLQAYKKAFSTK